MIKRLICIVLVFITLSGNMSFAGVPTGYPEKLEITIERKENSNELKVKLDGGIKYLAFNWKEPFVVQYSRDFLDWRWLGNDITMADFFKVYSPLEYYNAFKAVENIESNNFKDISQMAMEDYFKKGLGLAEIWKYESSPVVSTYLRYAFLLAMIEALYTSDNLMSEIEQVMLVPTNYDPAPVFYTMVRELYPKLGEVTTMLEIQEGLRNLITKDQEKMVEDYVDKNIYEKYVKTLTLETMSSYAYEDIEKVLYTLTWKDLIFAPKVIKILQDGLQYHSFDRQELVDVYWGKLVQYYKDNSSYLSSEKLNQLASIVVGRGSELSFYKNGGWAIPLVYPDANIEADQNAKNIAMKNATYVLETLSKFKNTSELADKQLATISYRLQYHYFAMQTGGLILEGSDVIKTLSTTEEGAPFSRSFPPIDVSGIGIMLCDEYVRFMNVVSEIALYRQVIIEAGIENLKPNVTIPNATKTRMQQLNQMKGAVAFLESLPYASVKSIVDFWYDRNTKTGKSLEDLYLTAINYGIDEDFLEADIEEDEEHPMSEYFDLNNNKLRINLRMGIAQSSLFIPLQTNVYEPYSYAQIENESFFKDWHAVWGYHRKVLYIDTSLSSAVNLHNTGKTGKLRTATLKDMLNPEKDIVLYTDTHFYNMHKLESLEKQFESKVNEVEKVIKDVGEKSEATSEVLTGQWDKVIERQFTSVANIVGDKFSEGMLALSKSLTPYSKTLQDQWDMTEEDAYVLSGKEIDKYLKDPTYSEMKTLAVQSAILRDNQKYGLLDYMKSEKSIEDPIFVSSKTLCKLKNITATERNSFFNFVLLKNIEENIKVDYKSTLDYNSPIYLDVYGNILTESGYVVVPAMANATLHKSYIPFTAAFLSTYGNAYKVSKEYTDVMTELSDIVELSEDETVFELQPLVEGDTIDLLHLSPNSENTKKRLYTIGRHAIDNGNIDVPKYIINVILEVMRGAPIEYIDKEKEGIVTLDKISRSGIVQAVKLDNLKDSLKTNNQNSVIAIPNLAFISGVEYVILFVYKLTLLGVVVLILIQVFSMAMTGLINLLSIGKILLTIILTISLVFVVPVIYETTYYQANKALLQDETTYMALLNLEKEQSGIEIGMIDVEEPKLESKLYLKMQDINVPWTQLFGDVIYAPIDSNFSRMYEEYARNNMAFGLENFQAKGDALYLDVKDLFNSSIVMFEPTFQTIYQYTQGEVPASFFTPYYVFLDALIRNTNKFNSDKDLYSYSSTIYKGGKLKSVGLIKEYLISDSFMLKENEDLLHLRQIYGVEQDTVIMSPFTNEDVSLMRESLWCNTTMIDSEVRLRISKLDEYARKFVAKNKILIGKISDESFLKVMALSLALEHNRLFGIPSADSLEIYNLSAEDLIRLSILPKDKVMKGSPYSYSRYVFENVGPVGVYLAAILEIILFISGWVKPAITILIFGILYISIFINRLVLNKGNKNIKGYLKLIVMLSLTNLLYSVLLKASVMLPSLGLGPAVCLIGLIVFHTVFLGVFVWVTYIPLTNWRDLGDSKIQEMTFDVKEFLVGNSVFKRIEERRENPTNRGWEFYKMLHNNDLQRVYKIEREEDI